MKSLLYCKPKIIEEKKPKKHEIFLNEHNSFSIAENGRPIGVFGQTGTGKTISGVIIGSQSTCIYFDPQGRLKEKLRQINEDKNWEYYSLTEEVGRKNAFKINASDLHSRVTNILARTTKFRDRQAMKIFQKFCNQKENRTYEVLRKMFEKKRLYDYWDEIKVVLDENDRGVDLQKIQSEGRHAIDISEITPQSMAIGLITETILGQRASKQWKSTPLIIACDECQSFLEKNTFVGRAFELIATKGRQYKVTPMAVGVSASPVSKQIKNTFKILILHKVVYDRTDYEAYGIELDEEKILGLPSNPGYCYYYYPDMGNTEGILLRPDTYFQDLRWNKSKERVTYKKEDFSRLP